MVVSGKNSCKSESMKNNSVKTTLPSPNFLNGTTENRKETKCFLIPCGMNLQSRKNPVFHIAGKDSPLSPLQCTPAKRKCKAPEGNEENERQTPEKVPKKNYTQCPVDECYFSGPQHTVEQHFLHHHQSKIYDRVKRLSTPEEIAAWREERRKRFPTTAKRISDQKLASGKVLEFSAHKSINNTNEVHSETGDKDNCNKCSIARSNNSTSAAVPTSLPATESPKVNALASILTLYASDEELEDEPDKTPVDDQLVLENTKENLNSIKDPEESTVSPTDNPSDQDCNASDEAPEEVTISHKPPSETAWNKHRRANSHLKTADPFRPIRGRFTKRRPYTLLEKLLEPHIRHERNVLLQCVRYICSTNFLGMLDKSTAIGK